MTDFIHTLPVDNVPLSSHDQQVYHNLFEGDKSVFEKFSNDIKEPILGGGLFIFLSLPATNDFIYSVVPYTRTSEISLLLFKALLFSIFFFVFRNVNLVMK